MLPSQIQADQASVGLCSPDTVHLLTTFSCSVPSLQREVDVLHLVVIGEKVVQVVSCVRSPVKS